MDPGPVVVIGEGEHLACFALAGAIVASAGTPDAVRSAWADLPAGTALVLLTPAARDALDETAVRSRPGLLRVVMGR